MRTIITLMFLLADSKPTFQKPLDVRWYQSEHVVVLSFDHQSGCDTYNGATDGADALLQDGQQQTLIISASCKKEETMLLSLVLGGSVTPEIDVKKRRSEVHVTLRKAITSKWPELTAEPVQHVRIVRDWRTTAASDDDDDESGKPTAMAEVDADGQMRWRQPKNHREKLMFEAHQELAANANTNKAPSSALLARLKVEAGKASKDHRVQALYGQALAEAGRAPEAVRCLRAAVQLAPANGAWHELLANARMASGDVDDQVIRTYEIAITHKPDQPALYYKLGLAAAAMAKRELLLSRKQKVATPRAESGRKCAWAFSRAIVLNPNHGQSYSALALHFATTHVRRVSEEQRPQDLASAEKYARSALKLAPWNARAYLALASAIDGRSSDNPEAKGEAIEACQMAIRITQHANFRGVDALDLPSVSDAMSILGRLAEPLEGRAGEVIDAFEGVAAFKKIGARGTLEKWILSPAREKELRAQLQEKPSRGDGFVSAWIEELTRSRKFK